MRSRSALRLSASVGSLRACAFICGDLDGLPENGERGWRRGFCALLRRRIGLDMLSAGSTLGLRAPNLRQRVFDSLDSLHVIRGRVPFANIAILAIFEQRTLVPAALGDTERPDRLQFMAGQVVLY